MAPVKVLFLVLNLITSGQGVNNCPGTTDFCSQVNQMQQVCSGLGSSSQTVVTRIGKAGAPGSKGEPGEPERVNYARINKKITAKFQELESEIDAKFEKYEQLLERLANRTKELDLRIHSECNDFTKDDAISWDGKGGIFIVNRNAKRYEVYCDLTTDDGGWLVFQRRVDGALTFQQNWNAYVSGFGNKSREFWLGLEDIHQLVRGGKYEIRIEISDWTGRSAYAVYKAFSVGDASTKYRLTFGSFSGTAGNALAHHNNRKFTTRDQDNDDYSSSNCAATHGGGWWFGECDHANLNGIYHKGGSYTGAENGIEWNKWMHSGLYSMKATEMKFRPMI